MRCLPTTERNRLWFLLSRNVWNDRIEIVKRIDSDDENILSVESQQGVYMKKIQWTVPIFNLFTLVFFLISAGILSTYETESVLFDEWLYFTLYFILSGIQTMILLFKKNDGVKKVLSILLTALKTYTIWLAFLHTQNLGFSIEGIPFYPVLVPTIITVILSIMELFFENAFLLLSDREEESIIGKAKKKTCILFLGHLSSCGCCHHCLLLALSFPNKEHSDLSSILFD